MIKLTVTGDLLYVLENQQIKYSITGASRAPVAEIQCPNYLDTDQRKFVAKLIYQMRRSPLTVLEILRQFDNIFGIYSYYDRAEELWAVSGILEADYGIMLWWSDNGHTITEITIED